MKWVNNWPVIGMDTDGDGIGEPVLMYQKPTIVKQAAISTPAEGDEFNSVSLGLQWQWQANPGATWSFLSSSKGILRLYSVKKPDSAKNLWDVPNLLMQKFPAEEFMATTKLAFSPNVKLENEKSGVIVAGLSYANLALKRKKDGTYLVYSVCNNADKGKAEIEKILMKVAQNEVYLRVSVSEGAKCQFSYSLDGKNFVNVKETFQAEPGKWIGAKLGLFCVREEQINDSGYADFDYFRIEKL
jgi:beta-xylosidase